MFISIVNTIDNVWCKEWSKLLYKICEISKEGDRHLFDNDQAIYWQVCLRFQSIHPDILLHMKLSGFYSSMFGPERAEK